MYREVGRENYMERCTKRTESKVGEMGRRVAEVKQVG